MHEATRVAEKYVIDCKYESSSSFSFKVYHLWAISALLKDDLQLRSTETDVGAIWGALGEEQLETSPSCVIVSTVTEVGNNKGD